MPRVLAHTAACEPVMGVFASSPLPLLRPVSHLRPQEHIASSPREPQLVSEYFTLSVG